MKARESGMPEEAYWASFFDTDMAIDRLLAKPLPAGDWVEFGCGYGTFTLPVARRVQGRVTALEIEPDLIAEVQHKATTAGITNIRICRRDIIAQGAGLASGTQAGALIYNLLHLEHPVPLLKEAHRVLRPGGCLSVMHWRSDIPTPRGPSLDIRPRPEQCRAWMAEAGFQRIRSVDLTSCCPYHFGLIAER